MAATISNLRQMQGMGIFGDQKRSSPDLQFRRFNLIYGFNGSGKSTLSRLFGSLEAGALHPKLPQGCSFEIDLDDGTVFGCPAKPVGLERRVLVFNSDFIDRNLQWAVGRASPVFFIGADQADAAAELAKLEQKIVGLTARQTAAEIAEKAADKAITTFKRDKAKTTALRLHQGNRKYEAPQLAADYTAWSAEVPTLLDDDQLRAAEDTRKLSEPMPAVTLLEFDSRSVHRAFEFVIAICGETLSEVALDEVQKFPDMLLWLKQGREFHEAQGLEDCLLCGNSFSPERNDLLHEALDNRIDDFVSKLAKTSERLSAVTAGLGDIETSAPFPNALSTELRTRYSECRRRLVASVQISKSNLAAVDAALTLKRHRPATAADTSKLPLLTDVEAAVLELESALEDANAIVREHNQIVYDFAKHRDDAGIAIRKHFITECRDDFAAHLVEVAGARAEAEETSAELEKVTADADRLRRSIRSHGPAADAINKLIASYLGHKELTIAAVEEGYEIHRHGGVIDGMPSEGEKTAIAISYFLSTIESDGRKLKDLIVIVDDPVSSLDSKALNYACSLVRSHLENASQLFVLTHNQQCMNEFKKAWRNRARPSDGKDPTAKFLFIDVTSPARDQKRVSTLVGMSALLREYDSEYHFLFDHVIRFADAADNHFDHGYLMPNILRRVLDIFLAFKCPGNSGLPGKIAELCAAYPELDKDRLTALERLSQIESHSDNLDDLVSFSSMTLEETREATSSLLTMMELVDGKHVSALRRICERARAA